MLNEPLLCEYDAHLDAFAGQGEALRAHLTQLLADAGLKLHSVAARIKPRESLRYKLSRPEKTYDSLWDVTDVIGLRVITYFEDTVDDVAQLVEAALPVDFVHSIDKRRTADDAFGYRSLHYVCGFGPVAQGALPATARCEIQIRTVLQHAWAEIEHDIGYKAQDTLPRDIRRRFSAVAGLLEIADREFGAIRAELETYAAALPERVAGGETGLTLDRLSLEALVREGDVEAADRAIARQLGKELTDQPFFPEYLLKMLRLSGFATVGGVRAALAQHRMRVDALVQPYFAFASVAWKLSASRLDRIYRGYSLFFLAHAAVLGSPMLGISKVERLARFYGELDYPDDERAAQRVASGLMEALRHVEPGES